MSTLLPISSTIFLKILNNWAYSDLCSAGGSKIRSIHSSLGVAVVARTGTYAYFVEPPIQYIRVVYRAAHPGAEQALGSRVVSDVLCAGGPGVAEATDARARIFVPPPGVVREVVVLDHGPSNEHGRLSGGRDARRKASSRGFHEHCCAR